MPGFVRAAGEWEGPPRWINSSPPPAVKEKRRRRKSSSAPDTPPPPSLRPSRRAGMAVLDLALEGLAVFGLGLFVVLWLMHFMSLIYT